MPKTLVTFLLDRTGSMEKIRDDTIGAFNAYLTTLQGDGAEDVYLSLLTFDSQSVDKICVNQPVKDVQPLTRETFVPRAWTPLIDAAYKTIKAVETSVNGNAETKVVICIMTDGDENASTEHSWIDLNTLIKEKTALGWQFNFMGAGIDAYKQGQRMGIAAGQTMSYDSADVQATKAAFAASAANTMSYARGMSMNTSYSAEQKLEAGDKFDPAAHVDAAFDKIKASPMKGPSFAKPTPRTKPVEKTKIVDDITL